MIRRLFSIGVFLVAALLGYNYFFGNEAEKEQSKAFIGKVGDLGKDAWDLLRSERDKLREGKYDDALGKLDGLYQDLRGKAENLQDAGLLERVRELSARRSELEELLRENGETPTAEARRKLEDLTAATEELMHEMEEKGQAPAAH